MTESTTVEDNPINTDGDSIDTTTSTDPTPTTDETPRTGDNLETSDDEDKPEDKSDESGEAEEAPAPDKFDEDLDDWAEKRGGDRPETDGERKALQELRNSQREFSKAHETKENTKKFQESLSKVKPEQEEDEFEDASDKRIRQLEETIEGERTNRLQSEFYATKGVSKEEGDLMAAIFEEKFNKANTPESRKNVFDFWAHPDQLDDLYTLAKARLGSGTSDDIVDKAKQAERERIAKEQQASGPGRNASKATASEKSSDAERLEKFSNWD